MLGAGGFGITYLAFDHQLDGPVALKEYFPAEVATRVAGRRVVAASPEQQEAFAWGLDRFIDEARLLAKLDHPNIVGVRRCFGANNTAYIVMEYVEGESLEAILDARGRLSADEWRRWLDPLLDGLAHVHEHGYLHRDIKPANIVIRAADGEPVLIDFGAARVAARQRAHTQVLTPGYAPIEQHSSEGIQGPPTDIYALAAVSYRALTGTLPPSAPDRALDNRYEPLKGRIPEADPAWLASLDHGLVFRPEDRPQAVTAWRAGLCIASTGPFDSPPAPIDRAKIAALYVSASIHGNQRALVELRKVAEDGSVDAQVVLGRMYADGEGVPKDGAEAVAWFRKAADQGFAEAQFDLGYMYASGHGAPHDDVQAAVWYRKAADQGDATAQYILATMYEDGRAGSRDYAQAAAWYCKAAVQGDATAQSALASMYESGRGVPRDYAQVAVWYYEAAEQGDREAQHRLGVMYSHGNGVAQDYAQAAKWLHQAAEQDHAAAQIAFGRMHAAGQGMAADETKAVRWFREGGRPGICRGPVSGRYGV